jgi:hypothetical protein
MWPIWYTTDPLRVTGTRSSRSSGLAGLWDRDSTKRGKDLGTERVSLDDVDGVDDEIANFSHKRACLAECEMIII